MCKSSVTTLSSWLGRWDAVLERAMNHTDGRAASGWTLAPQPPCATWYQPRSMRTRISPGSYHFFTSSSSWDFSTRFPPENRVVRVFGVWKTGNFYNFHCLKIEMSRLISIFQKKWNPVEPVQLDWQEKIELSRLHSIGHKKTSSWPVKSAWTAVDVGWRAARLTYSPPLTARPPVQILTCFGDVPHLPEQLSTC